MFVEARTSALIDVDLVDVHSSLGPWKVLETSDCVADSLPFPSDSYGSEVPAQVNRGCLDRSQTRMAEREGVISISSLITVSLVPSHDTRP